MVRRVDQDDGADDSISEDESDIDDIIPVFENLTRAQLLSGRSRIAWSPASKTLIFSHAVNHRYSSVNLPKEHVVADLYRRLNGPSTGKRVIQAVVKKLLNAISSTATETASARLIQQHKAAQIGRRGLYTVSFASCLSRLVNEADFTFERLKDADYLTGIRARFNDEMDLMIKIVTAAPNASKPALIARTARLLIQNPDAPLLQPTPSMPAVPPFPTQQPPSAQQPPSVQPPPFVPPPAVHQTTGLPDSAIQQLLATLAAFAAAQTHPSQPPTHKYNKEGHQKSAKSKKVTDQPAPDPQIDSAAEAATPENHKILRRKLQQELESRKAYDEYARQFLSKISEFQTRLTTGADIPASERQAAKDIFSLGQSYRAGTPYADWIVQNAIEEEVSDADWF